MVPDMLAYAEEYSPSLLDQHYDLFSTNLRAIMTRSIPRWLLVELSFLGLPLLVDGSLALEIISCLDCRFDSDDYNSFSLADFVEKCLLVLTT